MNSAIVFFILKIIAVGSYPILEYLLGKTSHGSLIGVVINAILGILNYMGFGPKQGEKK